MGGRAQMVFALAVLVAPCPEGGWCLGKVHPHDAAFVGYTPMCCKLGMEKVFRKIWSTQGLNFQVLSNMSRGVQKHVFRPRPIQNLDSEKTLPPPVTLDARDQT